MYLGKGRIRDMAKYINNVEEDMNYSKGNPKGLDWYMECRGAYFAALKMAELAGVQNEVHQIREELKK